MTVYRSVLGDLRHLRQRRLEGGYACFPWFNMPKLSRVLPGIQKGRYVIVTANSKVGKTQLGDYLFLISPLEFLYNHPESGLKLKIFYFSLEMSKEDKIKSLITYRLFKDHKITIDTESMSSQFEHYILEQEVLEKIEGYQEYFQWLEDKVSIIDHVKNPYGIYKTVRQYAIDHGKFFYKDQEVDLKTNSDQLYDSYVPDDPDEYVIVITDHLSLLQPEQGSDLWNAMFKFSSNYCLKMRDNFKYTVVNIQQQAMDQEKQQFTFKGESIVAKLKPSADGLGDCKLTGRDCDLMLGLFAPARYNIQEYPIFKPYKITHLRDKYRELSIILNRRGGGGKNISLYFNGACNYFEELPEPETIDYTKFV
jgi:hypothetical protein